MIIEKINQDSKNIDIDMIKKISTALDDYVATKQKLTDKTTPFDNVLLIKGDLIQNILFVNWFNKNININRCHRDHWVPLKLFYQNYEQYTYEFKYAAASRHSHFEALKILAKPLTYERKRDGFYIQGLVLR